jgi:hypothetical protein
VRYVFLIYEDESDERRDAPDLIAEYTALSDELKRRRAHVFDAALEPTATATSIRERDGKRMIIDGPFSETKEALAGFMVLDCDNLDEAIDVAARMPAARTGTIEVRPLA